MATETRMDAVFSKTEPGVFRIDSSRRDLRIGVIGKEKNGIDCSGETAEYRPKEKALVSSVTGISKKNIVFMRQVHEDTILCIDMPPEKDEPIAGDADGLITPIPGICLMIRTADCVPVFVYDPKRKILGAAHSGWRSSRLRIPFTIIEKMKLRYGSDPREVHVFILPSIGPASYSVKNDVGDLFPDDIEVKDGTIFLNLWQNIRRTLIDAGVRDEHIFNPEICSLQNNSEFYSFRGGDTGRNLNFCFMA